MFGAFKDRKELLSFPEDGGDDGDAEAVSPFPFELDGFSFVPTAYRAPLPFSGEPLGIHGLPAGPRLAPTPPFDPSSAYASGAARQSTRKYQGFSREEEPSSAFDMEGLKILDNILDDDDLRPYPFAPHSASSDSAATRPFARLHEGAYLQPSPDFKPLEAGNEQAGDWQRSFFYPSFFDSSSVVGGVPDSSGPVPYPDAPYPPPRSSPTSKPIAVPKKSPATSAVAQPISSPAPALGYRLEVYQGQTYAVPVVSPATVPRDLQRSTGSSGSTTSLGDLADDDHSPASSSDYGSELPESSARSLSRGLTRSGSFGHASSSPDPTRAGKPSSSAAAAPAVSAAKTAPTVPCKFFASGFCKHGEACQYSHADDRASRTPLSPQSQNKRLGTSSSLTSTAPPFVPSSMLGLAISGSTEVSGHSHLHELESPSLDDVSQPKPGSIPTLCKFFAVGACRKGELCPYMHVADDETDAAKPVVGYPELSSKLRKKVDAADLKAPSGSRKLTLVPTPSAVMSAQQVAPLSPTSSGAFRMSSSLDKEASKGSTPLSPSSSSSSSPYPGGAPAAALSTALVRQSVIAKIAEKSLKFSGGNSGNTGAAAGTGGSSSPVPPLSPGSSSPHGAPAFSPPAGFQQPPTSPQQLRDKLVSSGDGFSPSLAKQHSGLMSLLSQEDFQSGIGGNVVQYGPDFLALKAQYEKQRDELERKKREEKELQKQLKRRKQEERERKRREERDRRVQQAQAQQAQQWELLDDRERRSNEERERRAIEALERQQAERRVRETSLSSSLEYDPVPLDPRYARAAYNFGDQEPSRLDAVALAAQFQSGPGNGHASIHSALIDNKHRPHFLELDPGATGPQHGAVVDRSVSRWEWKLEASASPESAHQPAFHDSSAGDQPSSSSSDESSSEPPSPPRPVAAASAADTANAAALARRTSAASPRKPEWEVVARRGAVGKEVVSGHADDRDGVKAQERRTNKHAKDVVGARQQQQQQLQEQSERERRLGEEQQQQRRREREEAERREREEERERKLRDERERRLQKEREEAEVRAQLKAARERELRLRAEREQLQLLQQQQQQLKAAAELAERQQQQQQKEAAARLKQEQQLQQQRQREAVQLGNSGNIPGGGGGGAIGNAGKVQQQRQQQQQQQQQPDTPGSVSDEEEEDDEDEEDADNEQDAGPPELVPDVVQLVPSHRHQQQQQPPQQPAAATPAAAPLWAPLSNFLFDFVGGDYQLRPGGGGAGKGSAAAAAATYTAEQRLEVERIKRSNNHYDVLGVPRDAHSKVMKHQYKRLATLLRPDVSPGQPINDAYKAVSVAYHLLSEPKHRLAYDGALRRGDGLVDPGIKDDDVHSPHATGGLLHGIFRSSMMLLGLFVVLFVLVGKLFRAVWRAVHKAFSSSSSTPPTRPATSSWCASCGEYHEVSGEEEGDVWQDEKNGRLLYRKHGVVHDVTDIIVQSGILPGLDDEDKGKEKKHLKKKTARHAKRK